MSTDRNANLVRGLHRWDLVALVINSIIGAGIFGLPSTAFAKAGTYSLLAYLVSAVAVFLIILCFAEVGSRFTATGGSYLYARVTFGAVVGFQVGWLMWLGRIAAFAALSNLFIGYLGYFVPAAGTNLGRAVVIVTVVAALAITNIVGVRVTAAVTNALTVAKLIPLFLLATVGLFFVDPARYSLSTPPGYSSFSQATLLLAFTYMGFEGAAIPTGEMRDPAKHLPFALLMGLGVVVLVYMSIQTVCIGTLPNLASSERPLSDAGLRFLGPPGATLIAAGAIVSIGGTLNALMFATPRLPFAMAENRQLPQMFAATHPRLGTPIAAILLTAVMTLALALFSTFISALTMSAVVRLMAYMTTCAALPVLRRNAGIPRPPFLVPAGPVVSVIAVILSLWLLSNTPSNEMRLASIAVLLGFGFYLAYARRARAVPPVASTIAP
jgi:APA family basic amino acid/polyamine antiporter